jgi:hypothetical protein
MHNFLSVRIMMSWFTLWTVDLPHSLLLQCDHRDVTACTTQPVPSHPGFCFPHREAIKHRLDGYPLLGPEKRKKKVIRTADCLSDKRVSAVPLFSEHRSEGGSLVKAGPIVGVAFFWLLFLAKQEK